MNQNNMITKYQIIDNIDRLSKTITQYWGIIKNENVLNKKISSKRSCNLNHLYKSLMFMGNQRIALKLDQLGANLGFKSRLEFMESAIFKSMNQPLIFRLSELREIHFTLGEIKTIDNKKNRKLTEIFSKSFIENERKKIQIEMDIIKNKLHTINEELFDITEDYVII